jgi:hypothetical protein
MMNAAKRELPITVGFAGVSFDRPVIRRGFHRYLEQKYLFTSLRDI